MMIQNSREELTKLIDNLKEHSEYLNNLDTLPVAEIEVTLLKISRLYEKVAVLKHFVELDCKSRNDEATSGEIGGINLGEKTEDLKGAEEIVQLEELVVEENEAIEAMLEASMEAIVEEVEGDKTVETPTEIIMNVVKEEVEEKDVETVEGSEESSNPEEVAQVEKEEDIFPIVEQEEEVFEVEIDTQPNETLLDQLLEEAKQEEKIGEVDQSMVEKLEEETELSSRPDINEALSKEDSSVSSQLQKQPLSDLMAAIGLNERYLYSNELFDGDMDEFKNAVKMLNEFNNGEEAKAFFESGLRSTYGWEDDNTLAHALFSLVERRYL